MGCSLNLSVLNPSYSVLMLYITLTTDYELLRAECLELRAISSRQGA